MTMIRQDGRDGLDRRDGKDRLFNRACPAHPAYPAPRVWLCFVIAIAACQAIVHAHSGPPFPIVEDRIVGAYQISLWADPDATDDQSAAGQFWVMLKAARSGQAIPAGTDVQVRIRPLDRPGEERLALAEPIAGDAGRQFAALVMDHEGPYAVYVRIDGVLGPGDLEARADATYDLRPRPALIALFILPFVLVGIVWGKLLIKRRMHARGGR
jgi:hypothetical protein